MSERKVTKLREALKDVDLSSCRTGCWWDSGNTSVCPLAKALGPERNIPPEPTGPMFREAVAKRLGVSADEVLWFLQGFDCVSYEVVPDTKDYKARALWALDYVEKRLNE